LTLANGNSFEGTYVNGKPNGIGVYKWEDGGPNDGDRQMDDYGY
jgi:hypothetical protein